MNRQIIKQFTIPRKNSKGFDFSPRFLGPLKFDICVFHTLDLTERRAVLHDFTFEQYSISEKFITWSGCSKPKERKKSRKRASSSSSWNVCRSGPDPYKKGQKRPKHSRDVVSLFALRSDYDGLFQVQDGFSHLNKGACWNQTTPQARQQSRVRAHTHAALAISLYTFQIDGKAFCMMVSNKE